MRVSTPRPTTRALLLLALVGSAAAPVWGGEPEAPAREETPNYQHGISLLHPLKYGADFQHFEFANPDAPKGGHLVLSTTMNIANFSGQPGPDLPNAPGLGRTFDRLLIRTADELSGLYGWLVEGIALAEDKRSLRLRLHRTARWHDGEPITTRDVKFSFDEVMKLASGQVYFKPWIEEMEVLGSHELVVRHRNVFTNANLAALVWIRIRPAHYWAGRDPSAATLTPPVGSGPYRIAHFDRGYVHYERVDDYWGRDIPINRGRFNFDSIRYEVYRDATAAREGLRKGLIDLFFENDIRHWASAYDLPAIANGHLLRDTRRVRKFIGPQVAVALNTDHERLRDVRVREALTLAMDFEWQNRVFQHGTQVRAASYFAGSAFTATGLPSKAELELLQPFRDQLPDRVFTEAFRLPVSTGSGRDRAALVRAHELLAEAGWRIRDGKLVNAAGIPFQLDILTQNQSHQRVLLPYIEALKTLGIDVRLRVMDNAATMKLLRERGFQAYVRSLEMLNPPIGELHNHFSSTAVRLSGAWNLAGIRDPVVDALVQTATQAQSIDAITAACRALDRVLLWGFYNVFLNESQEERFLYWNKFGRPEHEATARYEYLTQSSLRVLDSWWLDKERAERLAAAGE